MKTDHPNRVENNAATRLLAITPLRWLDRTLETPGAGLGAAGPGLGEEGEGLDWFTPILTVRAADPGASTAAWDSLHLYHRPGSEEPPRVCLRRHSYGGSQPVMHVFTGYGDGPKFLDALKDVVGALPRFGVTHVGMGHGQSRPDEHPVEFSAALAGLVFDPWESDQQARERAEYQRQRLLDAGCTVAPLAAVAVRPDEAHAAYTIHLTGGARMVIPGWEATVRQHLTDRYANLRFGASADPGPGVGATPSSYVGDNAGFITGPDSGVRQELAEALAAASEFATATYRETTTLAEVQDASLEAWLEDFAHRPSGSAQTAAKRRAEATGAAPLARLQGLADTIGRHGVEAVRQTLARRLGDTEQPGPRGLPADREIGRDVSYLLFLSAKQEVARDLFAHVCGLMGTNALLEFSVSKSLKSDRDLAELCEKVLEHRVAMGVELSRCSAHTNIQGFLSRPELMAAVRDAADRTVASQHQERAGTLTEEGEEEEEAPSMAM